MSLLQTPITFRDVEFRNRVWVSPMCQYSSRDGHAERLAPRAPRRARDAAAPAPVIVEATAVTPEGRISPDDSGIWTDAHAEAFRARSRRSCASTGAVPGIQLAHAGRKASNAAPWLGRRGARAGRAAAGSRSRRAPSPTTTAGTCRASSTRERDRGRRRGLRRGRAARARRGLPAARGARRARLPDPRVPLAALEPPHRRATAATSPGARASRSRSSRRCARLARRAAAVRPALGHRLGRGRLVDRRLGRAREAARAARRRPRRLLVGRLLARAADPARARLPGAVRRRDPPRRRHRDRRRRADHRAAAGRGDPARPARPTSCCSAASCCAIRRGRCARPPSWARRATPGPRSTCARGRASLPRRAERLYSALPSRTTISAPTRTTRSHGMTWWPCTFACARPAAALACRCRSARGCRARRRRGRSRAGVRPTSSPRTSWMRPSARAGLGDDLAVEELRESHQDPGSFPTRRAQRSSPRFRRSSAAGRLSGHDRRDGVDLLPGHVDGVSREPGGEPAEPAARAPGVAADEDLHHLRRVAVETGDLEIVDLAAVLPVAVDELVVEDAERDVDLGDALLIPVLRSSAASAGWPRPRSR